MRERTALKFWVNGNERSKHQHKPQGDVICAMKNGCHQDFTEIQLIDQFEPISCSQQQQQQQQQVKKIVLPAQYGLTISDTDGTSVSSASSSNSSSEQSSPDMDYYTPPQQQQYNNGNVSGGNNDASKLTLRRLDLTLKAMESPPPTLPQQKQHQQHQQQKEQDQRQQQRWKRIGSILPRPAFRRSSSFTSDRKKSSQTAPAPAPQALKATLSDSSVGVSDAISHAIEPEPLSTLPIPYGSKSILPAPGQHLRLNKTSSLNSFYNHKDRVEQRMQIGSATVIHSRMLKEKKRVSFTNNVYTETFGKNEYNRQTMLMPALSRQTLERIRFELAHFKLFEMELHHTNEYMLIPSKIVLNLL